MRKERDIFSYVLCVPRGANNAGWKDEWGGVEDLPRVGPSKNRWVVSSRYSRLREGFERVLVEVRHRNTGSELQTSDGKGEMRGKMGELGATKKEIFHLHVSTDLITFPHKHHI